MHLNIDKHGYISIYLHIDLTYIKYEFKKIYAFKEVGW